MKIKSIFHISAIIIILFLSLVFHNSCENSGFNVDCDECYYPEPDSMDVEILLTFEDGITKVPLVVYRGEADKRNIDWIDTVDSSPYYLAVEVDVEYSVEAKYEFADKTIIAVDGTTLKTSLVSDVCSEDCYIIKNNVLDARLK